MARLRDRPRRKLPRIGVVRLGYQVPVMNKKTGKQRVDRKGQPMTRPAEADHFVLKDAPKLEEFYAQMGWDKVREMRVRLLYADPYRNFEAGYGVWAGRMRMCAGDGATVEFSHSFSVFKRMKQGQQVGVSVRQATGQAEVDGGRAAVAFQWGDHKFAPGDTVPCPGRKRDLYPHCAACAMSGVLRFMSAEPEVFELGYYQLSTRSDRNYQTILGVQELLPPEVLNKIPWVLRRVKESTQYFDQDGKLHSVDKWFVHLVPDPEVMSQLQLKWQRELFAPAPAPVLQLAPEVAAEEEWELEPLAPPPFAATQGPGEPAESVAEWEDGDVSLAARDVGEDDDQGGAEEQTQANPPQAPQGKGEAPAAAQEIPEGVRDPETVRAWMLLKAAGNKRCTQKQADFAYRLLDAQVQAEGRQVALRYLFEEPKLSTSWQASGVIDWLRAPTEEDDWAIDDVSIVELHAIVAAGREKDGQQGLPGMEGQ